MEINQIQINVKLTGRHTHSIEQVTFDAKNSKQNTSQPIEKVNQIITEDREEPGKENKENQTEATNFDTLRGKERIRVVEEIIEKFDGDCDKYRKIKQGENNEMFYSLNVLKKAKSEYLNSKGNCNWVDAITSSASTLQASIKGGKMSGKNTFPQINIKFYFF